MFLQKFPVNRCCLCGSSEKLTREHKIKASALRKELGKVPLSVGVMDSKELNFKPIQSTNSKFLKFNISICESCNTSATQKADKEFDRLNEVALDKIANHEKPEMVFKLKRYVTNSEPYLNVCRYFAKLLSCHLAQANAPMPKRLALFAIGKSDLNCIDLELKVDSFYAKLKTYKIPHGAAQGGLIVEGDKSLCSPNAFSSTLTIGPLQYLFTIQLNETEEKEMAEDYPEFFKRCKKKIEETKENPFSKDTLFRLGIKP
jgi:hypothetical protein